MSTFLIVSSAVLRAPYGAFTQPPTLDISGLRTPLDWGEVTVEVQPGVHRVAVFIDTVAGTREGALIPVEVPPDTGTRLMFAPPQQPGLPSMLRVDGQWPADAAMAYYAAKDARQLVPSVSSLPAAPRTHDAAAWRGAAQGGLSNPEPSVPAVGPSLGSTGKVPPHAPGTASAPSFGQVQSQGVEPARVEPPSAQPAPSPWPPERQSAAQPPFVEQQPPGAKNPAQLPGKPPVLRHDAYGRVVPVGDRRTPPIPTPEEFARSHAAPQNIVIRQGWYPDPYHRAELRWHDGQRWSASVMRGGQRAFDAI